MSTALPFPPRIEDPWAKAWLFSPPSTTDRYPSAKLSYPPRTVCASWPPQSGGTPADPVALLSHPPATLENLPLAWLYSPPPTDPFTPWVRLSLPPTMLFPTSPLPGSQLQSLALGLVPLPV